MQVLLMKLHLGLTCDAIYIAVRVHAREMIQVEKVSSHYSTRMKYMASRVKGDSFYTKKEYNLNYFSYFN